MYNTHICTQPRRWSHISLWLAQRQTDPLKNEPVSPSTTEGWRRRVGRRTTKTQSEYRTDRFQSSAAADRSLFFSRDSRVRIISSLGWVEAVQWLWRVWLKQRSHKWSLRHPSLSSPHLPAWLRVDWSGPGERRIWLEGHREGEAKGTETDEGWEQDIWLWRKLVLLQK